MIKKYADCGEQLMGTKTELTFEQAVARIDEIVSSLERGDAQLDKSLALFEEGVKLIESCGTMLDKAEQVVVRLQTALGNEQPKEYLFDDE